MRMEDADSKCSPVIFDAGSIFSCLITCLTFFFSVLLLLFISSLSAFENEEGEREREREEELLHYRYIYSMT